MSPRGGKIAHRSLNSLINVIFISILTNLVYELYVQKWYWQRLEVSFTNRAIIADTLKSIQWDLCTDAVHSNFCIQTCTGEPCK
ncbi:hypothetical protein XENTR_v10018793 [Xenopus tropicalis]|nr:hypothetical protein XENTR_v10018793 [Xenopus tropicalis]